jgi:hypoxanthine phosphoribosyltransferase
MSDEQTTRDVRVVLTAEQIQKRVCELGRQISEDYRGETIHAVCVLKNGFVFMADLLRELKSRVVCYFVWPDTREVELGKSKALEIVFSPEPKVAGAHVLVVEGLIETGVTSEFLIRHLAGRGAASVKLAALLDRQSARRVSLQPEYFGFLLDEPYVCGYGLGAPDLERNLPYVVAVDVAAGKGKDGVLPVREDRAP